MIKPKRHHATSPHFAIFLNKSALCYHDREIQRLCNAIRSKGAYFSVFEPESALDLVRHTEVATGRRRASHSIPPPFSRGGKVSALIACGGDGTANLVGRAAAKEGLTLGLLPLGKENNIARSLLPSIEVGPAIETILAGRYRSIDTAAAAEQMFIGSAGLGLIPEIMETVADQRLPRTSISWSRIAARSAARVSLRKMVITVDAFRFEVSPIIFNVNLLPYSAGLPLSPASIADDLTAEVIFDHGQEAGGFSSFVRLVSKKKYLYGNQVRLFRGRTISCHPVTGQKLYLDGELVKFPSERLDIEVSDTKLKVFA